MRKEEISHVMLMISQNNKINNNLFIIIFAAICIPYTMPEFVIFKNYYDIFNMYLTREGIHKIYF